MNRNGWRTTSLPREVLRALALLGLTAWVGGFTVYGGVVVPVLHEHLDRLAAGAITRDVTLALNAIGAAALGLGWASAIVQRGRGSLGARRATWGLLAGASALLATLIGLHQVMDARLDAGELAGFYPLHRLYLVASTAEWALGVGLILLNGQRSATD